jgi:hypothetical protein
MSQWGYKQMETLMARVDGIGEWLQTLSASMFAGKSLCQPKEKIQTSPCAIPQ